MDSEKPGMREDLIQETDHLWEDPRRVMALIDLIFLNEDPGKEKIIS